MITKYYEKATEERLENLDIGHPILINISESYPDIALFLSYNNKKYSINCIDTIGDNINVAGYDNCYIINMDKIKNNYLKILEETN